MLTWTAYGSWLQGDKRRYVRKGQTLNPDPLLEAKNKKNMKYPKVSLTYAQGKTIENAVIEESARLPSKIVTILQGKSLE